MSQKKNLCPVCHLRVSDYEPKHGGIVLVLDANQNLKHFHNDCYWRGLEDEKVRDHSALSSLPPKGKVHREFRAKNCLS